MMYSLMANCFAWIKGRKEPARAVTLVIIGLDDAGKTTMVAGLQGEPPDGITPTIGFANAELSISNFKVTVYDLGGGVRIRDVWRNYYSEVYGVVFVVDSSNGQRLEESKDVLQQVAKHAKILGKPFLIFANKQDKEGALVENEVSNILELEDLSSELDFPFKVVSCSALKGYGRNMDKNINTGFQWLLNTISGEFSKITARVEHDITIQKEEEELEKKARVERIRKIREERDRLEREAGNDPDKENSDDEVMMANPFQPIDKHLDNVKTAKEKKKKGEKEKTRKSENGHVEELKEQVSHDDGQVVKKRKKKKKKVIKTVNTSENEAHITSLPSNDDQEPDIDQQEAASLPAENEVDHVVVKKKKKRKVKKVHENTLDVPVEGCDVENVEENHVTPPRKKKTKKKKKAFATLEEDEAVRNNIENEKYELEELSRDTVGQQDLTEETEVVKKTKPKKKKKKRNRTVPIDDVIPEETNNGVLPIPAWKTPPKTWTSLPPISSNADTHFSSLPPLSNNKTKRMIGESSLEKIVTSPSWARERPNSEDYDIVT